MMFVYALAGWEGSAADGGMLLDALYKRLRIPSGKYYLGDEGYGLSSYCLTPFRGVRYHLREWAQRQDRPQNAKELFNLRHAHLRNVIKRIFGVLKKRFEILNSAMLYPMEAQVKTMYALFALHNMIRGLEFDDYFEQQYDQFCERSFGHPLGCLNLQFEHPVTSSTTNKCKLVGKKLQMICGKITHLIIGIVPDEIDFLRRIAQSI